MQNAIQSFNFESQSVRVFLDENNNPLFVAKDVATTLGYVRPNDAIKQHCKGAVNHRTLSTNGGNQKVRVIYEPDVYRLIFGSKLESAEKFQNWVFDEVLPTIRKTGQYTAPTPQTKLTDSQQRELANKVRSVCQNDRKRYPIVWNGLKEKFGVERYTEILSSDFDKAMAYVDIIAQSNFTDDNPVLNPADPPFFLTQNMAREFSARLKHIFDLAELVNDGKPAQLMHARIKELHKFLCEYQRQHYPNNLPALP